MLERSTQVTTARDYRISSAGVEDGVRGCISSGCVVVVTDVVDADVDADVGVPESDPNAGRAMASPAAVRSCW